MSYTLPKYTHFFFDKLTLRDNIRDVQAVACSGIEERIGADDPEKTLETLEFYDAVVLPAEQGSVITFLHPEYSSVVLGPDIVRIPLAYPLARHDQDWAHFINSWIELKQKDGTVDRLYKYWILGQGATETEPPWSILQNVLGWKQDVFFLPVAIWMVGCACSAENAEIPGDRQGVEVALHTIKNFGNNELDE